MKIEVEDCKWVFNLLKTKFFGVCVHHRSMRKNEKNVFCMDCNLCFCRHCVTGFNPRCCDHRHRRLQICRYVYHDVVRLQDIQKHFDCSDIQTYKINGEKAVHLNTRPQQHKDSKSKLHGTYCEACQRHIQDVPNRFCSIACKVLNSFCKQRFNSEGTTIDKESSFSSSLDSVEENIHRRTCLTSSLKAKKGVVHKRKGVPQRAPLC